ncbi:MAG: OmpW family outer membrane protein [Candidatus Kapabacteria bacterium]|nr:OmpW family outer membrane protein [Candidatus Kapabacteria bacterium]
MFRIKILHVSSLILLLSSILSLKARTGDIILTPRIGVNNLYTDLSKLLDMGGTIELSTGYFVADRAEIELELSYNFFPTFKYYKTSIENPEGNSVENNLSDFSFSIGSNYYLNDYTTSFSPYFGIQTGYTFVNETVDSQKGDENYVTSKNNIVFISPQIGLAIPLNNGGLINIKTKFMIPIDNSESSGKFNGNYPQLYGDNYKYWSIILGYSFNLN